MADTASDAEKVNGVGIFAQSEEDSFSDCEPFQIRMKRLAKLQNQAATRHNEDGNHPPTGAPASPPGPIPSTVQSDHSDRLEQPEQQPSIARSENTVPSGATSPLPSSQVEVKPADVEPKIRIRPASSATPKSIQEESTGGAQKTDLPTGKPISTKVGLGESIELWENRTLSNIFRITLNSERQQDSHGHQLRFLPGIKADLEEQGEDVRLNLSVLEQAILEASSNLKGVAPLDYLLACWKRVSRQFRGMRSDDRDDRKLKVIKEARRLCMSYCIFAVTMPEMFG